MTTLNNKYLFYWLIISGSLIYLSQKLGVILPFFIHNYYNNLICMPLVFMIINRCIRWLYKLKDFRVTWHHTIPLTLYFAWFFEYLMPLINSRYSQDIFDVFMYFCGHILYHLMEIDKKN